VLSPSGWLRAAPPTLQEIAVGNRVPTIAEATRRIPADAICSFMTDAFCACGLPQSNAATVARRDGDAHLSGSDAGHQKIVAVPKKIVGALKRPHLSYHPEPRIQQNAIVVASGLSACSAPFTNHTCVQLLKIE